MIGGAGADSLIDGTGADLLNGSHGDDWLAGGADDDTLRGGSGADTLDGDDGNDWLIGGDDDEVDFLNGGAGDDRLLLAGGDYGTGGDGSDTFVMGEGLAGNPAILVDFDRLTDRIEVTFDPARGAPLIEVEETDAGQCILVNKEPLALLHGVRDLDTAVVHLVPANS